MITILALRVYWRKLFCSPQKNILHLCESKLFSVDSNSRIFSVREILTLKPLHQRVTVHGWVQAVRKHRSITFMNINDGSCWETLQVIDETKQDKPSYGSSVKVEGFLVNSTHEKQEIELKCVTLTILGHCDAAKYPFPANEDISVKYTREQLHLRPKIKSFGALLRIRSHAAMSIHRFLQDNGFFHLHTPIITSNNCEGAGDIFLVQPPSNEALPKETNSEYFFNTPAYLSVSGQLSLEAAACALSKVYTFGPAFRAENSRTRHHLSEFQMVEVEQAFVTELDELLKLTENLFKSSTQYIMEKCAKDIELYQNILRPKYNKEIEKILQAPFLRMTYSEAVTVIQQNQKAMQNSIKWGDALLSEHEDFLLQYANNIPLFLTDYPINIKPFYMKTSSNKTAACFDLIAPFGGEICGGSLREDDKDQLQDRINKAEIKPGPLAWYLELREFGSVPHAGFGMGFDRFLQTILGIPNIREVVPFPRWVRHCQM